MVASRSHILARLLTCAALALALVPATARAEANVSVPAAQPLVATAQALAIARWGADPCGGQVAISWTHMGLGINARSQWMSLDPKDPTTYSACAVAYNLDVEWDWPKLCTVIEHELGHLTGHDHVNDPHDVMSPYYIYPTPECRPTPTAVPRPPDAAPRKATAASRHATAAKAAVAKRKASAKRKARSQRHPTSRLATAHHGKRRTPRAKTSVALAPSLSVRGPCATHLPTVDLSGGGLFGCGLAARR
jgi:Matrixin